MDPQDNATPTPGAADKPRDDKGRFVAPEVLDPMGDTPPEDRDDPFLSAAGAEERALLRDLGDPDETDGDGSPGSTPESDDAKEAEQADEAGPAKEGEDTPAKSAAAPAKEAEDDGDDMERVIARIAKQDPKRAARLLEFLAGDDEGPSPSKSPAEPALDDKALKDEWNAAVAKGGDFEAVSSVARKIAQAAMAPVLRDIEARKAADVRRAEAGRKFEAFRTKHPDWEKHKDRMVKEAGKLAAELQCDVLDIPPETAYRMAKASALMSQVPEAAAKAARAKTQGAAKAQKGATSTAPSGPAATKTPTPDEIDLGKTVNRFRLEHVRRNPF